jgi:signal transduction histidine kinase/CheY-like chemotaxis protein/streptogramin lyase
MKAVFRCAALFFLGAWTTVSGASPVTPKASAATARAVPLPTPQFRRFSTSDGLPSTSVYAVVQDHDGAIWLATKGGLARYDGVQFKIYRHAENDPGSLSNNGVGSLLVGRDGAIWAGGLNAGLNRYDAATDSFRHWSHDAGDATSLVSDRVWTMAQTSDGSLWVGTSSGLERMLPGGRGFEHVVNPLLGTKAADFGAVGALYVDARQQLWIGSSHGVYVRSANGDMRLLHAEAANAPLDPWRIDGSGDEIRIAIAGGLMIVGADGVAHRFGGSTIPPTNVMSSVRDHAGRLWIGTQKGLFLQTRGGAPVTSVADQSVLYGNLPGAWVWHLLVDREGGLWVALVDGGVAYLAPGWNQFSRFTHVPDDPASLRDSVATTMARGKDGRHVWVGERGGRIDRLDPVTGSVEHVVSDLRGDVVGMTEDAQHRLWVVLQGGLYRRDTDGRMDRVDPTHAFMQRPLEVEPGPDGQMYARTFGQGVFRIDPETLSVQPVPMAAADEKVRWGSQMTLRNGVFWYASDGGMMRLDEANDRFVMVEGAPAGQSVDAFDFTDNGIWMANTDGLTHYRCHGNALQQDRHIDAAHGWPSVNVSDLRVDAHGRVWIFGHDGLWRFDPVTGGFRSFGLQDGLTNGEFFRGFALMPSGYIYAATLGGVMAFDPDRMPPQTSVPQLRVTQARVMRHGLAQTLSLDQPPLQLDWHDSQLEMTARVFSYVDPASNHYRFRLRGLDNDWVDTGNRGERDFSGLAAGNYTLEVEASGVDGIWVHARPLPIHLQAPPWARWWAWLIYAALLAVLAWLGLLAWRRRLAQQHRIQLAEQRRQLAEQASAAKTQFLATLSHEIRTPMTGVMGMAELLLSTRLDAQQHDYTQAMQRSGSMLLKLLNDALDLARIEAGRLQPELAPFDPRQLVQEVSQLARGLAGAKHLVLRLDIATDLPVQVVGDAMRIKQILLNLTSNALKFTSRGHVTLGVRTTADGLEFTVSDTGPGIPEASQTRLFQRFEQGESPQRRAGSGLGLAICRELVEMMGGSIELQSRLGHGSNFHVRLPLAVPDQLLPIASVDSVVEGSLQLLLVEDDAIVAAVIRGLLQRQGHRVVHVLNGLAALAELDQASFDVILLDLDLPGVDGFQLARLIRQREGDGERVPMMAVTARSGADDEAQARAAGMDGLLRKPLTGEQLAVMLAQVIQPREASLDATT